jgi:hypothetical protein
MVFVPKRIHCLPEAFVNEGTQLSIGGEAFQGLGFPWRRVPHYSVKGPGMQHKKTTVYIAAITGGLFCKARYTVVIDHGRAVSPGWANSRQGRVKSLLVMKLHERTDVEIRNAIAIRHAKGFIGGEEVLNSL